MKRKLLILTVALLILSMSFASCTGNKEIVSLKIVEGLSYEVSVGATPDYSKVKAKVEYNDETTKDLTAADLTFGTIDTSKAGTQKLTITYSGFSITVDITVKAPAQQGGGDEPYSVEGAEISKALTKFLSKSFSGNFKDREAIYKVGDDNPFRFTLTLKTWDNVNDEPGDDITSYVSLSKVYLVTGTTEQLLEGNDLTAYVAVNENNNTFDFTDAAVGKTFRIETRPAEGVDETDADTVAAVTKSLTVEVVDAYNIYSAKELNIITNADSRDLTEYGKTSKTQLQLVDEFLQNNNITRPANLAGVVLHGDLTITTDDIPAGYLYSYTNAAGQSAADFYDHFSVFCHQLDSTTDFFGFYGNYFTLNTAKLPCVAEPGHAGNIVSDPSSSTEVFNFSVKETEYNNVVNGQQLGLGLSYDHTAYNTRVENLFMSGEDPNSNTEAEAAKSIRGLIAFKTHLHVVDFYNVLVEKHTVTLIPSGDNLDVTLEKCYFFNAWNTHMFVWNTNAVMSDLDMDDSDPSVFANYKPMSITIKASTLAKCGGPVIVCDSPDQDDARNAQSGAIITADAASTIYSYVTGQEAWFTAYSMTQLATQMIGLNQPISLSANAYMTSASFTTKLEGMDGDFINLIYVNRGPNGSFTLADAGSINPNEQMAATYIQATNQFTPGGAPVFQSSEGGIAFFNGITDGSTLPLSGLTGNPSAPLGNPDATVFAGDHLNIFYGGLSLFVGYFH